MNLPKKNFKRNDIIRVRKRCEQWSWYKPDSYRVVSYYLIYKDKYTEGIENTIIHESKVKSLELRRNSIVIIRWLVKVRSLQTNKYTEYAEEHMEYDPIEMRNKKIKKLIG